MSSLTTIPTELLRGCTSLTSVNFPNVKSVGSWSIRECPNLTSISLPSATSIGRLAFYKCTALTSVDLPNVTSTDEGAFNGCTGLTSVDLPSVTSIGNESFYGCTQLKNITLGKGLTSIGSRAISASTENVYYTGTLSEWLHITANSSISTSTIGNLYIDGTLMTTITTPDDVTSIGAQLGCFGSIVEVIIGDNVQTIGNYSFDNCKELASLTIGRGVTSIGSNCLYRWGGSATLATVTMLSTTPPTITTNTFRVATLTKIIVPAGCGDAYKSATNWSALASIIEEATE